MRRQRKKENNRNTISDLGPDRDTLIRAQTPQAFKFEYIYKRHLNSEAQYTDDVNLAFLDKKKINIVSGTEYNIKITTPEDIKIAEKFFLNVYKVLFPYLKSLLIFFSKFF